MAKKAKKKSAASGLAKWQKLAKRYEKATGKKATGLKLDELEEHFKKKRARKKSTSAKSTKTSGGAMGVFRAEGW